MSRFNQHLAARVFGEPLLVRPKKLGVILSVLGPRIGLASQPALSFDDEGDDVADLQDRESPPYSVTDDGVAVISISGALVRKSSWIDSLSGLQSYASIESRLMLAVQDDAVRGIVLDIDSPGGECGGCFDLADQIYAARAIKPIYSIANESMYSAAYALGSAASKVFLTRTAGIGSIGVIYLHADQSAYDEKVGMKYTALYAGARKNDFSPHEPLTDEAVKSEQAEINRLYDLFASTVARNRKVSVGAVKSTEAGLLHGEDAISTGLADSIGTLADALASLSAALPNKTSIIKPIFSAAASAALPSGEISTFKTAEASATANSTQGEQMPETEKPADQLPAAAPTQPSPPLQGAAAPSKRGYTAQHALETMHLCAACGKGLKAAITFVEKKTTLKQVRRALSAEALAKNEADSTFSATLPASSGAVPSQPQRSLTQFVDARYKKGAN
jgi:signal peptide peptidase SppA